jgi:hypothetical protein
MDTAFFQSKDFLKEKYQPFCRGLLKICPLWQVTVKKDEWKYEKASWKKNTASLGAFT